MRSVLDAFMGNLVVAYRSPADGLHATSRLRVAGRAARDASYRATNWIELVRTEMDQSSPAPTRVPCHGRTVALLAALVVLRLSAPAASSSLSPSALCVLCVICVICVICGPCAICGADRERRIQPVRRDGRRRTCVAGGRRRRHHGQCRRLQRPGPADRAGGPGGRLRQRRSRADGRGRAVGPARRRVDQGRPLESTRRHRPRAGWHADAASGRLASAAVRRVALGNPASVPAGVYARQWLERLGLWTTVAPKVVPAVTVRAALAAVRAGRVDAGVVYATDALTAPDVVVVHRVAEAESPAIRYPAAVVRGPRAKEEARRFVAFLSSDGAGAVFQKAGFTPVTP
ncbi:MAG: molybdate ABC transporter substrate-binding protein [Vicinamibacterales bacterium]